MDGFDRISDAAPPPSPLRADHLLRPIDFVGTTFLDDGGSVLLATSADPLGDPQRVRACGTEQLVGIVAGDWIRPNHALALADDGNEAWIASHLDPDGDGVWRGPWDHCADGSNDPDGDGVRSDLSYPDGRPHDDCPAVWNPGQEDADGDWVGDACDDCVDVANPDQADCDGVGNGDACTPDSDHDGIPEPCDLCPLTADSLLDCNVDAELERSSPELRDSCDPVPCAATTPSTTDGVPIDTTTPSLITTAHIRGPAVVASPDPTAAALDTFTATGNVGFRYCHCSVATTNSESTRRTCVDEGCALRGTLDILTGGERDLYASDPSGAWRPMAVQVAGTTVAEVSATFRSTGRSPPSAVAVDWPFTTDSAAQPLTTVPFGAPTALGVIWTQVRGSGACASSACERLAAHYWSGPIAGGTVHGPNPALVNGSAFVPWPAPLPICLYYEGSFPASFLGTLCLPGSPCGLDQWVVRTRGIELAAAPQVSAHLGKLFLDPVLAWTAPSEPREALGADAVRLVGTSLGQVVARVTAVGPTLGLVEDGQGFPKGDSAQLASAARAFAATGSTSPTGRGTILLGSAARLYALGGDLTERQSVVFTDLRTGRTGPIALAGEPPGWVIAATHRLTSPSALVLDRVPRARDRHPHDDRYHDSREHVRLLLVDLREGTSTVVRAFPWLSRFDRHALATLPDGDAVLVASSAGSQRHVVVRFRVTTGRRGELDVDVVSRAEGRGALLAAPQASIEGVSLAVARTARPWTVLGYTLAVQRDRRERDLDDCF